MIEIRPVVNIIGWLLLALGTIMLVPLAVDLWTASMDWRVFLISAFVTIMAGGLLALATSNARGVGLTLRQSFLLTTLSWVALPLFGAIPFISWPSLGVLPWLALVAVTGLSAHFSLTPALGLAPATLVAPMEFARLPIIALVGVWLYAEPLDPWVFLGAAIIFTANYLNLRANSARARARAGLAR